MHSLWKDPAAELETVFPPSCIEMLGAVMRKSKVIRLLLESLAREMSLDRDRAAVRQDRRRLRAQERLPLRDHALHRGVDAVRPRPDPPAARRGARAAGRRLGRPRADGDGGAR